MTAQLPPCPASLRTVQHYLKTASDYDQRDPVVSYWCRLYALQSGLKIDRSSHEAKVLLTALMDWLEKQKKVMADNESVSNDIAAQAYLENCALKLFVYADTQDRASNFGKDVVKAFYTAGLLFDVMTSFGELTEEIIQNRKYAKWKAAYIHKCLKAGERPQPGPMREEGDDDDEEEGAVGGAPLPPPQGSSGGGGGGLGFGFSAPQGPMNFPDPPSNLPPPSNFSAFPPDFNPSPHSNPYSAPPNPYNPPPTPTQLPTTPSFPSVQTFPSNTMGENGDGPSASLPGGVKLTADQMTKAQKYCKWAGSALSYDDVPTAVTNIKKALRLLETGVDS